MKKLGGFLWLGIASLIFAAEGPVAEFIHANTSFCLSDTEGVSVTIKETFVRDFPTSAPSPEGFSPFFPRHTDSDHAHLLSGIGEDLENDLPRLAFKDFLKEQGQEDAAEFVDLQISFADYITFFPRIVSGKRYDDHAAMGKRMLELFSKHYVVWLAPFYRQLVELSARRSLTDFEQYLTTHPGPISNEDAMRFARYFLPFAPPLIARFEIRRGLMDLAAPHIGDSLGGSVTVEGSETDYRFNHYSRERFVTDLQSLLQFPQPHIRGIEFSEENLYVHAFENLRRIRLTGRALILWPSAEHTRNSISEGLTHFEYSNVGSLAATQWGTSPDAHEQLKGFFQVMRDKGVKLHSLRLQGVDFTNATPGDTPNSSVLVDLQRRPIDITHLRLVDFSYSHLNNSLVRNVIQDHPLFRNTQTFLVDVTEIGDGALAALARSSTHANLNALSLTGNLTFTDRGIHLLAKRYGGPNDPTLSLLNLSRYPHRFNPRDVYAFYGLQNNEPNHPERWLPTSCATLLAKQTKIIP